LDGANGVGALKMLHVSKRLRDILNITVLNCHGKINYECGADYVKVRQRVPTGVDCVPYETCVSFDGDADRIVYFFVDDNMKFNLLDGDRIATLIANYLIDSLSKFNLGLKLGIVQTAYANGASTNYIENVLKVPVACVPTGVKHLHHRAKDFDIGVYFEANGHGTILFSENAKNAFREIKESSTTSPELLSVAERMLNFIDLVNETVGDALSDMLVVETILCSKGWNLKDWLASYVDLPNMQVKVKVKDRNIFETTDAERICVKPDGLQIKINEVVKKYSKARSFVRPSGTEDVVRVYAEAETKDEVKQLAFDVATLVFELADGIGDKPDIANF
jgi:phosphoacetylglucosamine mutase